MEIIKKRTAWISACIMAVCPLFISVPMGEKRYNIYSAFGAAVRSQNYVGFWTKDWQVDGLIIMAAHGMILLGIVLYAADAILMLKTTRHRWINTLKHIEMLLLAATVFSFPYITSFLIFSAISFGEFFTQVCLFEFKDSKAAKEQPRPAKIKKAKEKPYPAEFYHIILKNFTFYKSLNILLTLGGVLTAFVLYVCSSVYMKMQEVHGIEDIFKGNGLLRMFIELGGMLSLVFLFLMFAVVSHYIKNRGNKYAVYLMLGIRRKTLYAMLVLEYMLCILTGGGAGIILGIAASGMWVSLESLGVTFGVYLFICCLALMLNQDHIVRAGIGQAAAPQNKPEPVYSKGLVWRLIAGIILIALACLWFSRQKSAETVYIFLALVPGFAWVLSGGLAVFFRHYRKKDSRYFPNILKVSPFYSKFKSNTRNMIVLSTIQICLWGLAGIRLFSALIAEDSQTLFPYDVVGMAYSQDMDQLQEISAQYKAQMSVYPMVRITSIDGDEEREHWGGGRSVIWIQGQHIGISQSTYNELRAALSLETKNLGLKDQEMHVVYQQDRSVKAQPIDWDIGSLKPRLRFGQPLDVYNTSDVDHIFPERKIKSQERAVLTGAFHQGLEENLIVMSDEWFNKIYLSISRQNEENWDERLQITNQEWKSYTMEHDSNLTEGPTNLVVWDVPSENTSEFIGSLSFLDTKYPHEKDWDPSIKHFYTRNQLLADHMGEQNFKITIYGAVASILFIAYFFLLYAQYEANIRELKWQYKFLDQTGMRVHERKKLFIGQYRPFVLLPAAIGIAAGFMLTVIMWQIRFYSISEIGLYIQVFVLCLCAYLFIHFLAAWCIYRCLWKQINN